MLQRSLREVESQFHARETRAPRLIAAARKIIAQEPQVRLDYFEIVDPDTLEPIERTSQPTLVAVAAYVGATRLIDNVLLGPHE